MLPNYGIDHRSVPRNHYLLIAIYSELKPAISFIEAKSVAERKTTFTDYYYKLKFDGDTRPFSHWGLAIPKEKIVAIRLDRDGRFFGFHEEDNYEKAHERPLFELEEISMRFPFLSNNVIMVQTRYFEKSFYELGEITGTIEINGVKKNVQKIQNSYGITIRKDSASESLGEAILWGGLRSLVVKLGCRSTLSMWSPEAEFLRFLASLRLELIKMDGRRSVI